MVVIVFAASVFALVIDVFTGNGVGWIFGGIFILASVYAALQVRRADMAAATIAPPLVFAVLVVGYEFFTTTGDLLAKSVGGMNGLLDDGPMLWIGTGLAVLIVVYRVWQVRRSGRGFRAAGATRSAAGPVLPALPVLPVPPAPTAAAPPQAPEPSGPDGAHEAMRTTDAPPPS